MNKYAELLAEQQMYAQTQLIKCALPCDATMSSVRAIQHGQGGKTVYEHKGKPFLEIWPPEMETVFEDNSYKIRANQKYRVIK